MLWFCKWADRASFLVNHSTKAGAVALALEDADGEAPATVTALPDGAFRAEIVDDPKHDEVTVDIEEGSLFILSELEDGAVVGPQCPDTNLTETDETVRCELATGHAGEHAANGLVWS